VSARLIEGDCLAAMRAMAARGETVHAVVTDPPYHLTSIVKRFGGANAAPAVHGTDGLYARASAGFMGKEWDGGDIAFRVETWRAAWDVLPPGGHVVAFGGTRTFHRMAVAIEDAGFEIRDTLMWLYGTGFPKSHDVSKGIDKAAGVAREVVATEKVRDIRNGNGRALGEGIHASGRDGPTYMQREITAPGSPEAAAWQGWGTALKPAWEPIILARKPLAGTVAQNVLAHGTGALNIDGCRVPNNGEIIAAGLSDPANRKGVVGTDLGFTAASAERFQSAQIASLERANRMGRWPANVVHDGSDEVEAAFPRAPGQQGRARTDGAEYRSVALGAKGAVTYQPEPRGDSGSASRFFYSAKATAADRAGSKHPTVKPIALMRWLVRMVCPPGGVVLDPFAGSGTTGAACVAEGMHAVLIEREAEYQADIRRRLNLAAPEGHSIDPRAVAAGLM
jgi:DNA modification methylase